jgi:hypothetical protein
MIVLVTCCAASCRDTPPERTGSRDHGTSGVTQDVPCEWLRLDAFDAEVCAPVGARVSGSLLDLSGLGGACTGIELRAPDASNRQFVQSAGSVTVACVPRGDASCGKLCETIRPIPRPAERSATIGDAIIALSVSGGHEAGPSSRVAVWEDGTVELTKYRCPSTHTVRTTMSGSALATLLSLLKGSGVLGVASTDEHEPEGLWHFLRVRIDEATHAIEVSGDPTSPSVKRAFSLIYERVGIPRCD